MHSSRYDDPRRGASSEARGLTRRAAVAAIFAGMAAAASAQAAYPSRPVRLVVPFPPGGLNDTVARLLADALQSELRQTVIVDNRAGAAGLIGTQAVVEAPGDGYTVLVTSTSNHVLAPLTQKGARVDPPRDLQPVVLALRTVGLLVAPNEFPAKTLADFVALARTRPGQLNYASSGVGSTNHVQTERFKSLAGISITHVPYRGGGPLVNAVMAGEVQLALMDYATAEPALKSGRARALAQTGTRRHVAIPDVPTLAEAGFKDYDPSFWIGLAAPKSTPSDVVATLNAAMQRALAQTALKARAQAFGWTLIGGPPSTLSDTVSREVAAYQAVVRGLDLDR